MQWNYDSDKKVWDLLEDSAVVAKIYVKEKPQQKNAFIATSLIASIYTAGKVFNRLTRKNKSWKSHTKKFKSSAERERYIEIKKQVIQSYLEKY